MSSRHSLAQLLNALIDGDPFDLQVGQSIKFLPSANDRGFFQIGDGTTDMDLKIFLGGTGKHVVFDVGLSSIVLTNVTLNTGAQNIVGAFTVTGNSTITGTTAFVGNTTVNTGTFTVTGNSNVVGNTNLTGNSVITGNSSVVGNVVVTSGDLSVTGNTTLTGNTTHVGNTVLTGNTTLTAPFRPIGLNALSTRYELKWVAGQQGKPSINADIQDANEAVRQIADPLFEIVGTSAASAGSAYATTGGITLSTAGADNDQIILTPHLDTSQTSWKQTAWLTNTSVHWEGLITTNVITNAIIIAGLKLTNTPVVITDADQIFFRYETGQSGGYWELISSRTDVDVTTNTTVVVAASTTYHLKLVVNSDRTVLAYINGTLVNTAAALVTNISLIPYIGIQATETEVSTLTVRGQAISKVLP